MSAQNKTKQMYDIKIKKTDSQSYSDIACRTEQTEYLGEKMSNSDFSKKELKDSEGRGLNNMKKESRVHTLSRILSKKISINSPSPSPILHQSEHRNGIEHHNFNYSVTNKFTNSEKDNFQQQSELNLEASFRSPIQATNNINSYVNSNQQPVIQDLTLQQKILENNLRINYPDYQSLLILQKEVQLLLIDQKAVAKQIKNNIKKQRVVIDRFQQNLKKAQQNLVQKKKYLEQFYKHLDKKLKGQNGVPKSLFNKLTQLEKILNEKYLIQEKNIQDHLTQLKQAHQQYKQKIAVLTEQKQKALKKFSQQNSSNKSVQQIKNEHQKLHRNKQMRKRYQQLKKYELAVENQQNNQKLLDCDEKILKKLINIEEQHKKHFLIIQNGIKRQFKILLKDLRYKDMVGLQYEQKIPQLLKFIQQRKQLKQVKQIEIERKSQQLEQLKTKYNFLIIQYSIIQGEQLSRRSFQKQNT